jgi:DNA repair protein RecN (Recombination protein N)
MLVSLGIRNFVLIEDASLELGPGLTVLTGETGAGKTLLTQALGLLLGERAGDGLVGDSGDEALIQAAFELSPREAEAVPPDVAGLAAVAPGELVATRRLHRSGRNRSYLNGTAVSLGVLGEALGGLVAFSGQSEHRRLLEPGYQRLVLDAFAGPDSELLLNEYSKVWAEAREAEARLAEGERLHEERSRDIALLRFQVQELGEAQLRTEEEEDLVVEQRVLARAGELLGASAEAAGLLKGDGAGPDAGSLAALARSRVTGLRGIDPALDELLVQLCEVGYLLEETARGLRSYSDRVAVDPARLHLVEERLRTYSDLAKKYGGSTEAALAFFTHAKARLAELEAVEQDLASLAAIRDLAVRRSLDLAAALSAKRLETVPLLERAVQAQLADLGMPDSSLRVEVVTRPGWEGLGEKGADSVEFMLASNLGLPPRPLARIASGGELSRTLLAIKSALAGLEGPETLVFDEIDAGIGGRTALAVGAKLRELGRDNQVLAITHLPQVAAFADHHLLVEKAAKGGGAAVTRLSSLDGQASLAELCRMMGGSPEEPGALNHARALKDRAAAGLID